MSSEDLRKSQQDVLSIVQQLRSLSPSAAQSLALQSVAAQMEGAAPQEVLLLLPVNNTLSSLWLIENWL